MEKYTQIINDFFTANGLNVDDFFVVNIWTRQNEIDFQGWANPKARQKLTDIGAQFKTFGKGATAHETCSITYLSFQFRFCFTFDQL